MSKNCSRISHALLVLCAAFFLSCDRPPAPAATVQMEQADAELLRIAENARRTLPIFFQRLARADSRDHSFYIKHPFAADEDSGIAMEQLWLGDIRFRDGVYIGVLASNPVYISGKRKGDTVVLDVDTITDWMFVRDGVIAGGRSIRHLLERIPENQRTDRQQQLLSMFER